MKGQRSIAFTDKGGNWHYAVYNNAQNESVINPNKKMNLNQSEECSDLERKVVQSVQFFNECAIHYQDKDGTELLEHSYKDLKDSDATELGFKKNKLEASTRKLPAPGRSGSRTWGTGEIWVCTLGSSGDSIEFIRYWRQPKTLTDAFCTEWDWNMSSVWMHSLFKF